LGCLLRIETWGPAGKTVDPGSWSWNLQRHSSLPTYIVRFGNKSRFFCFGKHSSLPCTRLVV
jgi:hypothetical protein